jgi:hypothetical protein
MGGELGCPLSAVSICSSNITRCITGPLVPFWLLSLCCILVCLLAFLEGLQFLLLWPHVREAYTPCCM